MALHQLAHHRDFTRRSEGRAGFLRALHLDQVLDDLAALDQQRMHRLVDPVDFGAQRGERWGGLLGLIGHGWLVNVGLMIRWASPRNQRKH